MNTSQFRQMETRLAKAFLAAKTAARPRTASDVALKGYHLALRNGGDYVLSLLKAHAEAWNPDREPSVSFYENKPDSTWIWIWVSFKVFHQQGDKGVRLTAPQFLSDLGATVTHERKGFENSAQDAPQVYIDQYEGATGGGEAFTGYSMWVFLPGPNHPGVHEEMQSPEESGFSGANKPLGGALRDGSAWQYEPTAKNGQSGLFTFFTSSHHRTVRAEVKNDVGLVQAMLEACQSGASVPAMATLAKRLGFKMGFGKKPPGTPQALRALGARDSKLAPAWDKFMALALGSAGVPNASVFGTKFDNVWGMRFVTPSGDYSLTDNARGGLFDPLKFPVASQADVLALAKQWGKKLPKAQVAEARAYVG